MAKSTKAQEVSTGTPDSYTEQELADPQPPVVITRAELGGEKKWTEPADGMDSSESSKNESGITTKRPTGSRSSAPTMEKPSSQEETEQGSAPSITSSGPAGEEVSLEEVEPYEQWPYAELQAECKARGLTATGKAEDLITRLQEWDEANPE